jgi:hypothetical protein
MQKGTETNGSEVPYPAKEEKTRQKLSTTGTGQSKRQSDSPPTHSETPSIPKRLGLLLCGQLLHEVHELLVHLLTVASTLPISGRLIMECRLRPLGMALRTLTHHCAVPQPHVHLRDTHFWRHHNFRFPLSCVPHWLF